MITGVITMQSVLDNGDLIPTETDIGDLRRGLEGTGFEVTHLGMFGTVSIRGSRTLIKEILDLDLPDPPFGSYQHLRPSLPSLSHLTLTLEICPPIRHDI
jgi:hypothetical protein